MAEVADSPFPVGPWCWLLSGAQRIRSVPFTGQVSLFSVSDQLVEPLRLCKHTPPTTNESSDN